MPEIIVDIAKNGETKVSVNGVAGPGCRDLSLSIENAIGAGQACQITPEYYEDKVQLGAKQGEGA